MLRAPAFSVPLALMLVAGLGLGCATAGHVCDEVPDLDEELERRCEEGDGAACLAASVDRDHASEMLLLRRACDLGWLDGCEIAGRRSSYYIEERALFERGCVGGHRRSCAGLVHDLLKRHVWIWACADGASPQLADSVVLPLTLIGRGPSVRMQLQLGPLPSEARDLEACLVDVLDRTELPPFPAEGITTFEYALPVGPGILDGKRTLEYWIERSSQIELTFELHDDHTGLHACPVEQPKACRVASNEDLPAVYHPWPEPRNYGHFWGRKVPQPVELVLRYCVDETGRLDQLAIIGDAPAPKFVEFVELLDEAMHKWRFKPMKVDGHAIVACSQQRLKLGVRWLSSWSH